MQPGGLIPASRCPCAGRDSLNEAKYVSEHKPEYELGEEFESHHVLTMHQACIHMPGVK